MKRIKFIYLLLLTLLVSGCTKSEIEGGNTDGNETSGEISFGSAVEWTRGAEMNEITSLSLYSIFSYKKWEDEDVIKDDMLPFFTSDYTTTIELTSTDNGATLSYDGGVRYWPTGESEYLNFFALYPASELTTTFDETSGKPQFSYTMSALAGENDDLAFDVLTDMTSATSDNGSVKFNLEHLLSKLTLKAKLEGECEEDENGTYTNVSYTINGITIYGLNGNADLVINSDGTTAWDIDETKSTMDLTATQGVTFLPYTDTEAALNGDNYTDIMANAKEADPELGTEATKDQAIFVLPQGLGDNRDVAPTVKVRIRKSFDSEDSDGNTFNTEVIYETDEIEIPHASADNEDWVGGTHYALSFIFDISKLSEYDTPLTLASQIYGWSEATVDVEVQPNLYIYASDSFIEVDAAATYADFCIYTNYAYDLRRHHRKYELDGTPTEAAGFTYYVVDNTLDDPDTWNDVSRLEPVLLWDGSTTFGSYTDYDFDKLTAYTYGYNENNELYISSDGGINQTILTLDSDGYFDPTDYEDNDGWMYFAIQPTGEASSSDFYYKVKRTTRGDMHLYTNTAVGTDTSYGINKEDDDAVYILRLDINDAHLLKDANYGYFFGKIGAEAISNGGGLFTAKFKVTLQKEL